MWQTMHSALCHAAGRQGRGKAVPCNRGQAHKGVADGHEGAACQSCMAMNHLGSM